MPPIPNKIQASCTISILPFTQRYKESNTERQRTYIKRVSRRPCKARKSTHTSSFFSAVQFLLSRNVCSGISPCSPEASAEGYTSLCCTFVYHNDFTLIGYMGKKRLLSLDALKGFAILLVILGHVGSFSDPGTISTQTFLHTFIYVVHMPLFIMTAGYFAQRRVDSLSSLTNS